MRPAARVLDGAYVARACIWCDQSPDAAHVTGLPHRATIELFAMISRFVLGDFKGHRDTRLDLGRFTMLVGDNASGKTSVLDALSLQAGVVHGGDLGAVAMLRKNSSPEDLLCRGSEGPVSLQSEGTEDDGAGGNVRWSTTFKLELQPKTSARAEPNQSWRLQLEGESGRNRFLARAWGPADEGGEGLWDTFAKTLGTVGLYRLRAEQIAAAAYSDNPETPIEADGTNTAVALAAMKLGNDEAFQRVEDALRKLIPAVERIRIRRATVQRSSAQGVDEVVGSKLYFDFRGAPRVPADGASHGTLIVLALLAVLHGPNRPDLILLDDFDHALHPRAQMELVRMIKELLTLEEFKDVQVVATTHSPYMLDELEPSDVYAFALRDDGTVASKRLSEHPEAKKTRGTLKAGQLWSLDPERDWVLRG